MEPNPYQPPTSPNFKDGPRPSGDQDATSILAEIRDMQREVLELQRQAAMRQKRYVRASSLMLILLLPILFVMLASFIYLLRSSMSIGPPPTGIPRASALP